MKLNFLILGFVVSGCSHMTVVDGMVSESDARRVEELTGSYVGSLNLYGSEGSGEVVTIEKNATLLFEVTGTGAVLLEMKPAIVDRDCTLHFTKLMSIEEVRRRLRGPFSTAMQFALDAKACTGLPEHSLAQVIIHHARSSPPVAEVMVIKKYIPHGSFWQSDSSVYYGGEFVKY